jgi:hypothetical protein
MLSVAGVVCATAFAGCVKKQSSSGSSNSAPAAAAQPVQAAAGDPPPPPKPPAPPANPVPPTNKTGNLYTDRFLELWTDIHKLSNGYFSPEGIPYHSVESLIVEAPDHGHETTSEAYSYWIWLEALYGKVTKDWSHLDRAWANMEYYMIPTHQDQPTSSSYAPGKPATYAPEMDLPNQYPTPLESNVQVGQDPIFNELKSTYGTTDIYGMHWLLDVDNFYGFGQRGDGTSRAAYINTFQRGIQESVWEAIPQPCWEAFKWGAPNGGFLPLFQTAPTYARQWKYTNAPDADARAVQALYWAREWAKDSGGSGVVEQLSPKAAKLGDFYRYAFFDKYFKKLGCRSKACEGVSDYGSAHYLVSWYYAWGGAAPGQGWAWRIGSSHNHSGYQNPMAAYALSGPVAELRPKSPNGARDHATSLQRQLEFYRWLQAAEGGIAGGATNSWRGRYEEPPAGSPTFYGMAYDPAPVFHDPPSNDWFGFQVWSVQRVAEYYYVTGDPKSKVILDRWVAWVRANTKLTPDGGYQIPAVLNWTGKPDSNWDERTQNFKDDKNYNSTLRVKVIETSDDVGTTAALVHTLVFYAKKNNDKDLQKLCRELLDRMWKKYRDEIGIASPEVRKDFKRFKEAVHIPAGFEGKMPNGDRIAPGATFLSMRSGFQKDANWPKVKAYLDGGEAPKFRYHRFWAQAHIALAYGTYGWLFPNEK